VKQEYFTSRYKNLNLCGFFPLSIIEYSTNLDVDNKEDYTFEETQACIVEGFDYDWINETIKTIRTLIKKTRMPIWYYCLKLASLKMRPFVNVGVWIFFATVIGTIFAIRGQTQFRESFINMYNSADLLEQKMNVLFEWLLRPPEWHHIWHYALGLALASIITVFFQWLYSYLTPPSMFLFGAHKKRLEHTRAIYNFTYGTVIVAAIIIPLIINYLLR
jgi:hypothetical protein